MADLDLTKEKGKILASHLQQWNLLALGVKVIEYCQRSQHLVKFCSTESKFYCCSDILQLFHALKLDYVASDFRLFINISKKSIKTVLLHFGMSCL